MKNLFAAFLALQLILSPVAFAQSSGLSDNYLKTGTGSSGGYDFYFQQISGIGTSAIGSSILSQCIEGLKVPSIATFMAGSLVHIGSEILGAKSKNDRNKKKMEDLEINSEELAKSGDSSQLDALKAALQEEKDNVEFLKNRKAWMIAVNVIYTAAVALAITEEFSQITASTASGTTICTGLANEYAATTCAATTVGYAACVAAENAIHIPACTAVMGTGYISAKSLPSHSTARQKLPALCASNTLYKLACEGYGQTALALVYGACLPAPTDGGTSMFSWSTLLAMAYGFGSGQLGGGGQISTYGSMAVSLLTAFVPAASKLVEKAYNFPIPRSITFGALDVLAIGITTGLAKRQNIAEDNVSKLEKAIADFKLASEGDDSGIGLGGDLGSKDPNNLAAKKYEVKKLPPGQIKKNCISSNGGAWDISEKSCGKPVRVGKANLSNINSPTLNNVSNLASEMAQSLADGNEAKALSIAGQIGTYAARVKAEAASLKAKYNQYQKKNKLPVTDFDKSIKDQVASLQNSFNQAAASKNIDLASLGAPSSTPDSTKKNSDGEVAAIKPLAPAIGVDPLAGLGGTDPAAVSDSGVAGPTEVAQSLDDFESPEQDISKKSDVSIFKQLSNRYILNYTKIFDRRKEPVPAVEADKN
jgi:hypothetical protein